LRSFTVTCSPPLVYEYVDDISNSHYGKLGPSDIVYNP